MSDQLRLWRESRAPFLALDHAFLRAVGHISKFAIARAQALSGATTWSDSFPAIVSPDAASQTRPPACAVPTLGRDFAPLSLCRAYFSMMAEACAMKEYNQSHSEQRQGNNRK